MNEDKRQQVLRLLAMAKALRVSMDESIRVEAPDDVWKYSSYGQFARKYNELVKLIGPLVALAGPIDVIDLEKLPSIGSSYAMVQKQYFETVRANLSMLIAYVEEELGVTRDEIENLANSIAAKLRQAIFDTPELEIEVQNGSKGC
jgi:hypothetical protein